MVNKKILIIVTLMWSFHNNCMNSNDFPLRAMEEGNAKREEKSPKTKSLAQEHVELRSTLSILTQNMTALQQQLTSANNNVETVNTALATIQLSEKNINTIHGYYKYGTPAFFCGLCCCVVIPIWIVLGYIVAKY